MRSTPYHLRVLTHNGLQRLSIALQQHTPGVVLQGQPTCVNCKTWARSQSRSAMQSLHNKGHPECTPLNNKARPQRDLQAYNHPSDCPFDRGIHSHKEVRGALKSVLAQHPTSLHRVKLPAPLHLQTLAQCKDKASH